MLFSHTHFSQLIQLFAGSGAPRSMLPCRRRYRIEGGMGFCCRSTSATFGATSKSEIERSKSTTQPQHIASRIFINLCYHSNLEKHSAPKASGTWRERKRRRGKVEGGWQKRRRENVCAFGIMMVVVVMSLSCARQKGHL